MIINYKFNVRQLLFEALQSSSNLPPRSEAEPSLALGGQRALEAISWQLFWVEHDAKDVTLSDVGCFAVLRKQRDGDANQFRLHMYIGAAEAATISSRVRAILGAVWLDSERDLEQVKDLMRVLNFCRNKGSWGRHFLGSSIFHSLEPRIFHFLGCVPGT